MIATSTKIFQTTGELYVYYIDHRALSLTNCYRNQLGYIRWRQMSMKRTYSPLRCAFAWWTQFALKFWIACALCLMPITVALSWTPNFLAYLIYVPDELGIIQYSQVHPQRPLMRLLYVTVFSLNEVWHGKPCHSSCILTGRNRSKLFTTLQADFKRYLWLVRQSSHPLKMDRLYRILHVYLSCVCWSAIVWTWRW